MPGTKNKGGGGSGAAAATGAGRSTSRPGSASSDPGRGRSGGASRGRRSGDGTVRSIADHFNAANQQQAEDGSKKRKASGQLRPDDSDKVSSMTVGALRDLIKTEMTIFYEEMSALFETRTRALETEVANLKQRVAELESHVENRDQQLDALGDSDSGREERLKKMEKTAENMEAEGKLNYLIFSGSAVPAAPERAPQREFQHGDGGRQGEDVIDTVIGVLKSHLPSVPVNRGDVATARRIGNGKILCKFERCGWGSVRDRLYYERISLRRSAGRAADEYKQLFISEYLTVNRLKIFQALLAEKRKGTVNTVFSNAGTVYCRLIRGGAKMRVNDVSEIPQLVETARH